MTAHMHIGLAALLRQHGISQRQLADAAGMRPATLNAIFQARVQRIELDTLTALVLGLRRLGIPADVGDILQVVEGEDAELQASKERALALLDGEPWGRRPAGLETPVPVQRPPIEDLLAEHRGPE